MQSLANEPPHRRRLMEIYSARSCCRCANANANLFSRRQWKTIWMRWRIVTELNWIFRWIIHWPESRLDATTPSEKSRSINHVAQEAATLTESTRSVIWKSLESNILITPPTPPARKGLGKGWNSFQGPLIFPLDPMSETLKAGICSRNAPQVIVTFQFRQQHIFAFFSEWKMKPSLSPMKLIRYTQADKPTTSHCDMYGTSDRRSKRYSTNGLSPFA